MTDRDLPDDAEVLAPLAGTFGRRVRGTLHVAVAASVPLAALAAMRGGHDTGGSPWVALPVAVAVGGALLWRVRAPLVVFAITLVGLLVTTAAGSSGGWLGWAVVVAVFTVAAERPWRVSTSAAAVAGVVLFALARSTVEGPVTEPRALIVVAWTGLALAMGIAGRTQRAYVQALADRVRRADETREQVARARVAEERVRIARELHDVVAHHIAVINVHAGLARAAQHKDAALLDSSLQHVQDAAGTVLGELGTVLRVLRAPEARDGSEPAEPEADRPTPGLAAIDDLVDAVTSAGLQVRRTTAGRPRPMDPAAELTAYRVVQESLTNATKHGAGTAELGLQYAPEGLRITVANPVGEPARPDGRGVDGRGVDGRGVDGGARVEAGHGLIGMRERVEACGGTVQAGRDASRVFRVAALVPYQPGPADTAARGERP